jgi:hypothetical protein
VSGAISIATGEVEKTGAIHGIEYRGGTKEIYQSDAHGTLFENY